MKAHLAKVSLALLSAAFLLGCQEQGSAPVGPDGPQFDKPFPNLAGEPCNADEPDGPKRDLKGHCHGDDDVEDPNLIEEAPLFDSPKFTCAAGATNTEGDSFGKVRWQTDRIFVGEAALPASDHIHYELQLTAVDAGDYTIFGNQAEDLNCDETDGKTVDIGTVKVKKNGGVVTPGILQFEFPRHDAGGLTTHVWVTVSGPGGIFRSPAVKVVIPPHTEVQ